MGLSDGNYFRYRLYFCVHPTRRVRSIQRLLGMKMRSYCDLDEESIESEVRKEEVGSGDEVERRGTAAMNNVMI